MDNARLVSEAFSAQSGVFDALDKANPLVAWVRDRVRWEVMQHMRAGAALLELNAGTGIDSFWFAEQGIKVLATDNAPGMIAQLQAKSRATAGLPVEVEACDFHRLGDLAPRTFDHLFSNFGGLNCTDRLQDVLHQFDALLKPGGTCSLVIMPRTSPWELVEFFRGNSRMALRRWRSGGAPANVEGTVFTCHYHDPAFVRRNLPAFEQVTLMTLSCFVPPPHLLPFAQRHPRFVRSMERLEAFTCKWPLIRSIGDHFLIILRKR
jgi:ubiquinone/menaquinone biosynthesis C-methylase UbiE